MKTFFRTVTLLLLFVPLLAPAVEVLPDAPREQILRYRAEYLNNYDGDSVTLLIHAWVEPPVYVEAKVRLLGIDTPEIRGKCDTEKALAAEAKTFVTEALIEAKYIYVDVVGRGKYGRLLVVLTYDNTNLATELVELGYARIYEKRRAGWCGE